MRLSLAILFVLAASTLRAEPPDSAKDPFAARRARLQKQVGEGLALVPSAPAAERFRQENDFWYLTGMDWPDSVLAVSREGAWLFEGDGKRATPAGFEGVLPAAQLGTAVSQYSNDGLWLPGGRSEHYSAFNNPGGHRDFGDPFARSSWRENWKVSIRAMEPEAKSRALEHRLARMRLVKDASELALLRKAAEATGKSLIEAISRARTGQKENEFQQILERGYKDRGAEWLAFPSIVGSGKNGTTIHYTENAEQLDRNELVVVDTGAEIGMYACDVTRTFPANGKFTKRQREVYEAVLAAQEAGIASIRPGTTLMAIDAVARKVLADRGFAGKMPHLTSHWVGLQVHDVGDYGAKLEPGMVLTVEPGVYLVDESIGVRIEDVLVLTEDGAESLTGWIPKTIEDLEKLTGSATK
ncbi:MAG: aminopeptidase P N-terminal domain-containing protein [Planctomycetes bacterium]|nr:aminopeptidase P N-terminal domain-containing protein [Planctomycetota bacterium]